MNKKTLIKLGKLLELKRKLHNKWVDSGYQEELRLKCELVQKVFKCLEEQSRGFQKSKIPYGKMADFLIEHGEKSCYRQLHQEIMLFVLRKII